MQAWHTLTNPQTGFVFPVYKYARQRENLPPQFYNIITSIGSPGKFASLFGVMNSVFVAFVHFLVHTRSPHALPVVSTTRVYRRISCPFSLFLACPRSVDVGSAQIASTLMNSSRAFNPSLPRCRTFVSSPTLSSSVSRRSRRRVVAVASRRLLPQLQPSNGLRGTGMGLRSARFVLVAAHLSNFIPPSVQL